ncbi:hypothetical protein WN51_10303 [Melipona quadrifasciata]|uniref:Uncharacterized protein n=1 Tax=Melipona quadrifasciata TaxID=166423 RepID=A0A0M9A6Z5_9HYME|nr:hypothetical protein WN51_10303 [Melipona quadrifasciata]
MVGTEILKHGGTLTHREQWNFARKYKRSDFTLYITLRFVSLKGPEATVLNRQKTNCRRDSSVPDNATPPRESRGPNQPIANFRCISVAPEEARFSGLPPLKSLSVIICSAEALY